MVVDQPRKWDRFIDPILFVLRDTEHSATHYTPFELLYGRRVRGPLSIIKDALVGKNEPEPEVQTVYNYIFDLKNKFKEMSALVQQSLIDAKTKQNKYYNLKNVNRRFKVGDYVLLLLPTDQNKLMLTWKGPFRVSNVVDNGLDYDIEINGKIKRFHVNMLKRYLQREEFGYVSCSVVVNDGEEECIPLCNMQSNEDIKSVYSENSNT